MKSIEMKIELLSETIFGSGESLPGFVDLEIIHDEYGLPYLKGKTIKGKLREEAENIASFLDYNGENKFKNIVDSLFGKVGNLENSILRFSNCEMEKEVKRYLVSGIESENIISEEVLEALTDVRYFTKINKEGIAEDGSLRQVRVINRNLKFTCEITPTRELTSIEIGILSCAVASLRHIGCMESRGKGHIVAKLFKDNKNVTNNYINELKKEIV